MDFELIVATSQNGTIGNNNKIPWYIPEDLKHFKKLTNHSIIIMGRKTYESLPNGPLPNRLNIVLSRTIPIQNNTKNVIFTTIDLLFDIITTHKTHYQKVFVIGGCEIYSLLIDYCTILHITTVYAEIEGDCIFPITNEYIHTHYTPINNKPDILYSINNNTKYQYIMYSK
jgi:dihydrofolate reductase